MKSNDHRPTTAQEASACLLLLFFRGALKWVLHDLTIYKLNPIRKARFYYYLFAFDATVVSDCDSAVGGLVDFCGGILFDCLFSCCLNKKTGPQSLLRLVILLC